MSLQNHALYQVAAKALLLDGDKILALVTPHGFIDFPGGRIDESEVDLPWQDILSREIAEELGTDVKFTIGDTLFVAKRQYEWENEVKRIAAIYFACQYEGGDIRLSDEHGSYNWMTPQELLTNGRQFFSQDEKAQISAYFAKK